MKGHCYEDLEDIQSAVMSVLNDLTSEDFKGASKNGKDTETNVSESGESIMKV